ncbi:uncharacterized protein LOC103101077 [Monodelphis domestica]|uniref:uncharacterized protein LOC103101077 n=1 Tax=Monodelphis domestica TaxID=13616 RepID=UPI0004436540|nr:uncharacterized protein LOC103101077 [Monodelphis domestica]XP_007494810.1 uncharacterized protein LOC103101077 [Monodelphis domestica]
MPGTNSRKTFNQKGDYNMLTTNQVFFPPQPPEQVFPVQIRRRKAAPLEYQNYAGYLTRDFHTVHKEAYGGWDPSNYQQPKPIHLKDELTNMMGNSNAKFDDSTVTKISFLPPSKTIRVVTGKQPTSIFKVPERKFQDISTNKEFFQNWGVQPRTHHRDIHDGGTYLKPVQPFESQTTTKSNFLPIIVKKVKSFKPKSSSIIDSEGKHEFSTAYKEAYRPLQLPSSPLNNCLIQNQDKDRTNTETTTELT